MPSAQEVSFPGYRQLAAHANRTVRGKPMIHGLVEVDVTRARSALRAHKARTGESVSFTAFLAACLAKAVDEDKAVQAFRQGGRRLVLFDDVDVNTRVEREVDGQKYVIPYILRAANHKTVRMLHDEIRTAQVAEVRDVLTRFRLLPRVLYGPFFAVFGWLGRRAPRLWKQVAGTVGLTAVGMFGSGPGWGVPCAFPTALTLTVGGIGEKVVPVDGRPAVREVLCLTISVDHDVVDGAPAARFTRRLTELIESAHGLDEALGDVSEPRADAG